MTACAVLFVVLYYYLFITHVFEFVFDFVFEIFVIVKSFICLDSPRVAHPAQCALVITAQYDTYYFIRIILTLYFRL